MKTFVSACLAGLSMAAYDTSNHWAVIMAGSKTYSNYRHQADTAHAFQIMLDNGIPREQIIYLSYDDVPTDSRNPFPGQLFNKPDPDGEGVNVYDSSHIDYRGEDVTKENFFKVLMGDDSAPGPVLKSNSESKVFVNFVDHGGAGLICTPVGPYIYADELDDTLKAAKEAGMFKELVFYLETCESGSMFPNLEEDGGIYAVTASNATQSSWGAYCGSDAEINGQKLNTCLGDLFSINWMEDTMATDLTIETLEEQFTTVKTKTTKSPVMRFGDTSFTSEPIGDFEGSWDGSTNMLTGTLLHKAYHFGMLSFDQTTHESVDSRDLDLHFYEQQVKNVGSAEAQADLDYELQHRSFVDGLFAVNFPVFGENDAPEIPQDFDCLRLTVNAVEEMCGKFSAYSLKYVRKLANVCDTASHEEIGQLMGSVHEYCNTM